MAVKYNGLLDAPSGAMSLTITVPDSVPSLLHSSKPWVPSSASKNTVSPTAVNES